MHGRQYSDFKVFSFSEDDCFWRSFRVDIRDELMMRWLVLGSPYLDMDDLIEVGVSTQLVEFGSSVADIEDGESTVFGLYEHISSSQHIECNEPILEGMVDDRGRRKESRRVLLVV